MLYGFLIFAIGGYMFLCPDRCTRKLLREDETAVAKTKKKGVCLMVFGVILLIIFYISLRNAV